MKIKTRLIKLLKQLFIDNWLVKLIALFLAIGLWLSYNILM